MSQVTIPTETIAVIETARAQMRQIERLLSGSATPEALRSAAVAIKRLPSKAAMQRAIDRAVQSDRRQAALRADPFAIPAYA